MSVLGEVFGSLESMSQLQLLFAFIACSGYAFAQGSLLPWKGRRAAWVASAGAAVGFAFESSDWTHAAMLLGFAVVGMGSFVASVWITSRALGFARSAPRAASETVPADLSAAPPSADTMRPVRSGDPVHSV